MKKLSSLKCLSCSGKTPKLNNKDIQNYLKKVDNWEINESKEMIFKKINFKNFKTALNFANKVGIVAENESHHPDLSIGYGYCLIIIHTHAIKGLSLNDFILASKIDLLNSIN